MDTPENVPATPSALTVLYPLRIELRIRTPHGVPIEGARVRVIGGDVEVEAIEAEAVYMLALPRPGDYQLVIERFQRWGGYDHRTLRASLFYVLDADGPQLRSLAPPEGERSCIDRVAARGDTFAVDATLDYLWFTPIGYPPTYGNRFELFIDGAAGWAAVAAAMRTAQASIHVTTWLYDPTTELERPDPFADAAERRPHTIQDLLEERAEAGTRVRLLLWDAPFLRQPAPVRRAARATGDNFEALEQANTTGRPVLAGGDEGLANRILGNFQVFSYHQKTIVVDGRLGFCGGMNLRENDWDACQHGLFDARRCRFASDHAHRAQVARGDRPADYPPRHDYIARIEGPAVEHLERNFQQRYNYLIARDESWAQYATPVSDPSMAPPIRGGVQVQVVRTMPEPFRERGILDVHVRALRTARRLIYIEDQYFRSTHVSDAIADAVRAFPGLHVVVTTQRSQADDLLAGGWSREAFDRIRRRLPHFELHTLMIPGDGQLVEVDTHAKLMIVDDLFMTVGSANINDRGFEYEGEINLAVVDPTLVKAARLAIWREHLGDDRLSGDIDADAAVWREHAAHNRTCMRDSSLVPRGRVFPFEPRIDRRRITAHDVM